MLAKAPGTGYIGIPDKKQIVETCGKCHSDVEFMNPFGIRTDQLARYHTSTHGKKLFVEGDTRTAACSDCHSYHDVLPVSDPRSPVYPLNVPKTCNKCHGNEKLMSHYGIPATIFETYKESVHGKAILEKQNLSSATCVSCHGSHGAVPPGVKDIAATCGKCHQNERTFFLESVHAPLVEKGKFSECISCHGFHEVKPASPSLFDEACVQCHRAASSAFVRGQLIKQWLVTTRGRQDAARDLVKKGSMQGLFVEEEEASLRENGTLLIEMAVRQHALMIEKISELGKTVNTTLDQVESGVHQKIKMFQWRKWALVPLWLFIFIMVVCLGIKYRRLKFWRVEKRRKSQEGE